MKRLVIIGIGNRLMKDDGIGVAIAEHLQQRIKKENIEVIIGETDVRYCLRMIKENNFILVIDSMYSGKKPGSITVLPLQTAALSRNKPYSQHEMSLLDLMMMDYPNTQGYMIGIEICEIGFGLEFSDEIQNVFQTISENIITIIEQIDMIEGRK